MAFPTQPFIQKDSVQPTRARPIKQVRLLSRLVQAYQGHKSARGQQLHYHAENTSLARQLYVFFIVQMARPSSVITTKLRRLTT
jgi:hypothetical protein